MKEDIQFCEIKVLKKYLQEMLDKSNDTGNGLKCVEMFADYKPEDELIVELRDKTPNEK